MRQVIVFPGEDGYWVAECPSLPGCLSQGATKEEVVVNIKEAIRGYIAALEEGNLPIPVERSTEFSRMNGMFHQRASAHDTGDGSAGDIRGADHGCEPRALLASVNELHGELMPHPVPSGQAPATSAPTRTFPLPQRPVRPASARSSRCSAHT